MSEDIYVPFDLPAASGNKVFADSVGGATSYDGGLLLLREADRLRESGAPSYS